MSARAWVLGLALGAVGCGRGCAEERSSREDLAALGIPAPRERIAEVGTSTLGRAIGASMVGTSTGAAGRLAVPRPTGVITLDGKLREPSWRAAARTGPFRDEHGDVARPYSEARFLVEGDVLYLGLYAADEDVRAREGVEDDPVWRDDAFTIQLVVDARERFVLDVNARGVFADGHEVTAPDGAATIDRTWKSGLRVATDVDGTIDDAKDDDEEWIVEAALPLAAIGGSAGRTLRVGLGRCDTPKDGTRRCGSWGHAPGAATSGDRGVLVLP